MVACCLNVSQERHHLEADSKKNLKTEWIYSPETSVNFHPTACEYIVGDIALQCASRSYAVPTKSEPLTFILYNILTLWFQLLSFFVLYF
jgi:hypothetical protein